MYRGLNIKKYFIIILMVFSAGSIICEADVESGERATSFIDNEKQSEINIEASEEEPIKLNDGYELAVKSVDIDGNKVFVELSKDGKPVYGKVIIAENRVNGTFFYSKPGTSHSIKVHFKNSFRGAAQNLATVDRVWQTSEIDSSRLLINDSRSRTIESGIPLKLEEGYELAIKSIDIDGKKIYLELLKNGEAIQSRAVIPANEIDDTFIYAKPGTPHKIEVHFKNAFRGAAQSMATVDRVWQTSETDPSLILINDSQSRALTSRTLLKLEEGYELVIESLDIDGNKVYVELFKDGQMMDSKVIVAANEVDDTFVYTEPGTSQLISVHFASAFRGADRNLAIIDGISQ